MSDFTLRLRLDGGKTMEIHGPADITKEATDAIVNAANSSLLGGGGVDGAIHSAGGPSVLAECRQIVDKIGRLPAGKAVLTTGGKLSAKYVVHTVGPVYRGGNWGEAETLANCYRESIRVADDHAVKSLAFPAISTGAYGYPLFDAASIALTAVANALPSTSYVSLVRFVLFDDAALRSYLAAAETLRNPHTSLPYQMEKGLQ